MISYLKTKFDYNFKELARDIFVFAISPLMIPLGFFLWIKYQIEKRKRETR
tara:strand:- start:909 stop:1061 length:153 start_codon:yes stop_codon:yes gene_type:complete